MQTIDALILPALAASIVTIIVVTWRTWFKTREDRALNFIDDDEGAGPGR